MTVLYIAEKSSVGRALANVLAGEKKKENDHIRCGGDVVAWASGHLLELCEPEDYDEHYKQWTRDTLLYVPREWKRKEIPRTKGLLDGIRKLLKEADTVVNVGDADKEGQLLIDEILDYCGWHGPTKRVRINDINPSAIRKALDAMRGNSEFRGEYMAGQARLYADWLVGLAMTRFVTVSLREEGYEAGTLSVGRVQTPTLGLVVARDREIQSFSSSLYYELKATLILDDDGRKITGRWVPGETHSSMLDEKGRITDKESIHALCQALEGRCGEITSMEKKERSSAPPLPFSLSKLQIAASKKYDITDTLVHVQKLYESGYVSYPRSGCEYIPEEHFTEAPHVIDAIRAGCPSLGDMLGGVDLSRKSAAWNTSKITEHHAVTPTTRVPLAGALSETERKIYELICARYVLQFLPNCEYEETVVEFNADGNIFRTTGRTVTTPGWQGWDKQDTREKQDEGDVETDGAEIPPAVRQGETGKIQPNIVEKTSKPPQCYTYHSLLAAMNGIHAFVKDPDVRQKLKEIQGIGTEATQENIIAVLFKRGYLEKKKKQVVSTNLGQLLIDLLNKGKAVVMVSPDMTALWEQKMADIESEKMTLESFVSEVADMTRDILSEKLDIPADISDVTSMTRQHKCLTENCEGFLRHIQKPEKSPFFSCPVCHATFNDINGLPSPKKEWTGEIVEATCPLGCGRNARKFSGRYGPYWKCLCSPDVTFKDVDGQPVVKEQHTEAHCPVKGCKGKAVRLTSKKDGRLFWTCDKCGNFFDDKDGKPEIRDARAQKNAPRGASNSKTKGVSGV